MGTHHQGNQEEVRALDTYIKVLRAAESLSVRVHRHLAESGLTVSQFGVLEALMHLGPLCQRELGQKLLKSSGDVTLVIDNLEKRGLVERRRDRKDRRFVSVHLTDEGHRLIHELFPRHVEAIMAQMSALDPQQQAELGQLCRQLGRNGNRQG